jgi:REP element-mobilizing transposase RayT
MKSNLPRRHSLRLPDYDYAHPGGYFVTIVTQKHICLFGEVVGDTVLLNGLGLITEECWQLIPEHFPNIESGAYVVMPNHLHGIIFIKETVGATHASPHWHQFKG